MEIKLPAAIKGGYELVNATLLYDIAPHLAHIATFAVHRCIKSEPTFLYKNQWFVTNVETGFNIAWDRTKAGAIRKSAIVLANKSEKDLLEAYAKINGGSKEEEKRG